MSSLTKTVQSTPPLAIFTVAAGNQKISSEITVASNLEARLFIDVAPEATNGPGTEIRVEEAGADSGNSIWTPVPGLTWITTKSAVSTSPVDGTRASGSTSIAEASTSGLAVGQYVFFKNTTLANSEWHKIVALSGGVSFDILDALANAQTGSTWYNMAERFQAVLNITSGKRFRVVINNNFGSSPVAINVRVACITADSIA